MSTNNLEQESVQVKQILKDLQRESGIEILLTPSKEYKLSFKTPFYTPITLSEAEVIATTVCKIPGASTLISLIIPNRQPSDIDHLKYQCNGRYFGHNGTFVVGENGENKDYTDWPPSNKSVVLLDLPNIAIEETITPEHLGLMNPSTRPSSMFTIYREVVAYVIAHELGHGLIDHIRIVASADKEEYLHHHTRLDPYFLFKGFANLVGWRLKNMPSFETYDNGGSNEQMIHNHSHALHTEWRKLKGRKNIEPSGERFSSIEEAFADYWALSILYPELLSTGEKSYFNIFHQELTSRPKEFIRAIAHGEIVITYQ